MYGSCYVQDLYDLRGWTPVDTDQAAKDEEVSPSFPDPFWLLDVYSHQSPLERQLPPLLSLSLSLI